MNWLNLVLFRSSHRRCSVRKGVLRNFVKLTGRKHLCQGLLFNSYFYNLDQDPEPLTRTLDLGPGPGLWTLKPDPGPRPENLDREKPGPWKAWTLKNLDLGKPLPWKTWTLKNLDLEKYWKRLDMEKWLEEHILYNLLTLKIC